MITAQNSVVKGLVINRFDGNGVEVDGTEHARIEGNFIGTNPAGTRDRGNDASGVATSGSDTTVGGASRAARNLISGNGSNGFFTGDFDSLVQGNLIGTDRTGTKPLGNGGNGVSLYRNGTVGGDNAAFANVIAFNGGDGVAVRDTGNRILGSSIFSNGGLGIDLNEDGPTPNDGPGDVDAGPNNLQNFPLLSSAKTGRTSTTIRGTLRSVPGDGYLVQFFSNPKGTRDEGKKFLGEKTVTDTDGDGVASFAFKPRQKVRAGTFVTATATNVVTDDTSEFSAPKKVEG